MSDVTTHPGPVFSTDSLRLRLSCSLTSVCCGMLHNHALCLFKPLIMSMRWLRIGIWAVAASVHDRRDADRGGWRLLGCALAALHKRSVSWVSDPEQITGAAPAKQGNR